MLPLADRPFEFFPPKPSRFFSTVGKLYNRYYYLATDEHKITKVVCEQSEAVQKILSDKRNKILFISNHPSHSDSQVVIEAFRQMGITSNFMAAYDLFLRKRNLHRWVMQMSGAFSVDRENFNSQPIKEAIHSLINTKYQLTLFPEGRPYLQNDIVTPFQPGGAFISQSAQKSLDERLKDEKIYLVPIAIKLSYVENCRKSITNLLREMAVFLNLEMSEDESIVASIEKTALALMDYGLKEGQFPPSQGASVKQRQISSVELILNYLENEMDVVPDKSSALNERIVTLRKIIHKIGLTPHGDGRRWAYSRVWGKKLLLAMRILSYPTDYLNENPTVDRCGEVVERLTEDKLSRGIFPYAKRQATVKFGKPFTLSELDPENKMNRNEILASATMQCQDGIQKMVNQINLENVCEGGQLF